MSMEDPESEIRDITVWVALAYAVTMFIAYYLCWGREFVEYIRATAVLD